MRTANWLMIVSSSLLAASALGDPGTSAGECVRSAACYGRAAGRGVSPQTVDGPRKGNRGKMIATALRVFDAVQLNTDAERRWHRVGLWMASLMLLPSGYLMMLGLAAKAPFMGLWASMPFVALASLLYTACRIRGRAITTLSAGAKALSAWAKQEWERCMRTLARLQLRVGTWMYRNALRRLKRQSFALSVPDRNVAGSAC